MDRKSTVDAIEEMRKLLAKQFGVTIVEDHSGQFGDLGAQYCTVRWNNADGDFCEVHMHIKSVEIR